MQPMQDTSTRVWDLRSTLAARSVMCGNMGAVRSLRYSPDGRLLAAAEPADFVRLYHVASDYTR
jgi:WD40 repeat protein